MFVFDDGWMPIDTRGTSPSARREHRMVYLPWRSELLLFGGITGINTVFGDTYVFPTSGRD